MDMNKIYPLFAVLGLEIEYMLVEKNTLNIAAKSDLILKDLAKEQVNEYLLGDLCISNEFVLHILELKNPEPKPIKFDFTNTFQQTITALQIILDKYDLTLLPTGAHPWMNPLDAKHWPHDNHEIYQQYHDIFNCTGHGWSNLQSMHVNLPFANDEEFCILHNAIRLLLPILPAIAASSPILDSKFSGFLDTRLRYYGSNQTKLPTISGKIIPEIIHSQRQYQETILQPMYQEIAPFDPNNTLQFEWLNSRAAIPKFERMSIEIRILDTQECIDADFAIVATILYHLFLHQIRYVLFFRINL